MGLLHRALAGSITEVWDTQNRLLHTAGLVRRPVAAQWLVTAACDLKCPHCYSEAGRRATNELSTEEAKRLVIDPLAAMGCGMLVLAGGELLLRRDIPELVEYAVSRGMGWAMHTHGGHVPRFAALMRRHPPALAAISLDGDRSFHDAFRGRDGSFDAALRAAEILADAGCREVVLGTTITADNADAVADMFPLVASSRAHSWGLHLFAPEGRGHDHAELFPNPGQLRRVAAFARRRRSQFPIELCNEWGSAGIEDLYYRDQPFTCGAGSISLVISASGDLLPCTTTDPAEREGNVRDTPLPDLWRSRFARFRSGEALVRGECWLQSRNGVQCSNAAFGAVAKPPPLWVEHLPSPATVGRAGTNRVLGPRSAAAVGLAAAGLVFLQGCARPARTAHAAADGPPGQRPQGPAESSSPWTSASVAIDNGFPPRLAEAPQTHYVGAQSNSEWARFRQGVLGCEATEPRACEVARTALPHVTLTPEQGGADRGWTPGAVWSAHLDALQSGTKIEFADALTLLTEMEQRPAYDAALAAHLWRAVRTTAVRDAAASNARVRLYARLHRHHRVIDAIKRAEARTGPVEIRPWLKKSMPPANYDSVRVPRGLARAVRRAYQDATATTWITLGLQLTVRGGPLTLARSGTLRSVTDGQPLRLSRLDVIHTSQPVELGLDDGRVVKLGGGEELTLFDLPSKLSATDRRAIEDLVQAGATGDRKALDTLEAQLGITHAAIRDHLAAHAGASPLRGLLVIFDE